MSSHKSLFSKTPAKKAKLDSEEKQGETTLPNAENSRASTSAKKPAFNPALLNSAFYTGPVSYGGAGISATVSPYNQYSTSKFYDKKKIDIKVVPSKTEATVGQIAKTICECLESYSSPISDAKRVPVNNRPPFSSHSTTFNNFSIFDTSRRSLLNDSVTSSRPHRSRELQIPSIAALSKIKKTNRCSNARAAIMASMSSSLPCEPRSYKMRSEEDNSTYKNKMKTKINTIRSGKNEEEEMAQPVHLKNISLNITSLPTFSETSFPITPKYLAPEKVSSPPVNIAKVAIENNFKFTNPTSTKETEPSKSLMKFKFSEPLDIFNPSQVERMAKTKSDQIDNASSGSGTNISSGLKFSKPDTPSIFSNFKAGDAISKSTDKAPSQLWNGIDNNKNNLQKSSLVNGDVTSNNTGKQHSMNESPLVDSDENANIKKVKPDAGNVANILKSFITNQQQQWECSSCMTRNDQNKDKCVCCEAAKPITSTANAANSLEGFIKKQQQQWECSSCMTRNEQNKDKCVCCEALKPGATPQKTSTPASTFSDFGTIVQKQQEQWECSSCMTRNEQSKEKCVCCETAKPGVSASKPSATTSSFGFGSFVKKQQEQWECSSCMTRNEQSKDKCVCCETAKPGSVSNSTAPTTKATSLFSGFGNLIKNQQEQWACSCCMTRNDQNRNKCACCEAAKPGSEPSAAASVNFNFGNPQNTFKFGIDKVNDSAKTSTDSSKTSEVKSVAPVSSIFGNQTSADNKTANGSVGGFKFGVPSAVTSTESKVQPTSTFSFGEKKETSTKPSGEFSFGLKASESVSSTAPTSSFVFGSSQKDSDVKKDTPSTSSKVDDSKFVNTTQTKKAQTTLPSVVQSETKPLFSYSVKSTDFSNNQFSFGSVVSTTPPTTSTNTFTPSKPFVFGQNVSDSKVDKTSKPSFQLPSSNAASLFSPSNPTSNQGVDNKPSSVLPSVQFASNTSTDIPKDPPPSFFSFGAANPSVPSSGSTFKSPASNAPVFSFGSATKQAEPSNLFSTTTTTAASTSMFGAKPLDAASPSSLFKPQTTAAPTFGSSPSTNLFKSPTDSPSSATNVFGAGALSQPGSKPPAVLFGSSALTSEPNVQPAQNTASPFSTPNVPAFGSGNIFGNTASSSTAVNSMPGSVFGTSMNKPSENASGLFNIQQPAAPLFASSLPSTATSPQASNPIFGSSPSVPTPVFGASIPFGEASQNQTQQNISFKFGSPSASQPPPTMGFGQAPAAGSSAPVFSFGSGSAAPPTNSQFNFSMGAPTSAFSTGLPGARRIKKAVRRSNVR